MSSPLIEHIAHTLGCTADEATAALNTWVEQLQQNAQAGEAVIPGVGTFRVGDQQNVSFTPEQALDVLANQANTPPPPITLSPPEEHTDAPEEPSAPEPTAEASSLPEHEETPAETEEAAPDSQAETASEEPLPPSPAESQQPSESPASTEAEPDAHEAQPTPDPSAEDLSKGVWQPPRQADSALGKLPEDRYEEADFSVVSPEDAKPSPEEPSTASPEAAAPDDKPSDAADAAPIRDASFLSELVDLASQLETSEEPEAEAPEGSFAEAADAERKTPEADTQTADDASLEQPPVSPTPPASPEQPAQPEPKARETSHSEATTPVPPPASPYAPPARPRTERPPRQPREAEPIETEAKDTSPNWIVISIAGGLMLAVLAWLGWSFLKPSPPPPEQPQSQPVVADTARGTPPAADTTTLATEQPPDTATVALTPTPTPEPPAPATSDSALFGTAPFEKIARTYTIVVASVPTREAAETEAVRFRAQNLRTAILYGAYQQVTSHRIAVGQFPNREAAIQARETHRNLLPDGAWIMRIYQRFDIYNSPSD